MPNIEKAERRDKKRQKKIHGMRMHGKDIAMLLRAQEKRDRERAERRERRERERNSDTG